MQSLKSSIKILKIDFHRVNLAKDDLLHYIINTLIIARQKIERIVFSIKLGDKKITACVHYPKHHHMTKEQQMNTQGDKLDTDTVDKIKRLSKHKMTK